MLAQSPKTQSKTSQSVRESLLGRQLYVGNIPPNSHWQDIKDLMRSHGQLQVIRVNILHHHQQQQPQVVGDLMMSDQQEAHAIVLYGSKDDAKKAIEMFDGRIWQGRRLTVRLDESLFSLQPHEKKLLQLSRQQSNQPHQSPGQNFESAPVDPENNAIVLQSRQVFVSNLPYCVGWQDLKDLFREAGRVQRADVKQMQQTGQKSRGCGTVLFSSCEEAQRSIEMLNGFEWFGRKIDVKPDRHFADPCRTVQSHQQSPQNMRPPVQQQQQQQQQVVQQMVHQKQNEEPGFVAKNVDVQVHSDNNLRKRSDSHPQQFAMEMSQNRQQQSVSGPVSFATVAQQPAIIKPSAQQPSMSGTQQQIMSPVTSSLSPTLNSPISAGQPSPRETFGGFPMWTSDTKHTPINIPQPQSRAINIPRGMNTQQMGSSNVVGSPGFSVGSAGSASGSRLLGTSIGVTMEHQHVHPSMSPFGYGSANQSQEFNQQYFHDAVQQLPISRLAISPPSQGVVQRNKQSVQTGPTQHQQQPRMPPPGFPVPLAANSGTILGKPTHGSPYVAPGADWPPGRSVVQPPTSALDPTTQQPVPGKSTLAGYLRAINQSQKQQPS